ACAVDVGFVLKKALEVQQGITITTDSLPPVIESLVTQLDSSRTGHIPRGALVQLIQTTCSTANMVAPGEADILQAMPLLASSSVLPCATVLAALQGLQWSILPRTARSSVAGQGAGTGEESATR
ncbi:hypothetical protein HaLaN_22516, partial [Haematococcus lacustris]